jgi:hypothetical protein
MDAANATTDTTIGLPATAAGSTAKFTNLRSECN